MKRLLLWLIGVALGVVVLLGAVMAVSYAFTTQGSLPGTGGAVRRMRRWKSTGTAGRCRC